MQPKIWREKKKVYEEMYFFIPSPKEESSLTTSNLHITLDHNSEYLESETMQNEQK